MIKYNFPVLIEQDEDGMYVATVPDLKGCHTQAKTMEKLLSRVKEAIDLCVEVEKEKFGKLPQMKFIGLQQIEVPA
jgi:predicted RNase H-like HicB family nuclease